MVMLIGGAVRPDSLPLARNSRWPRASRTLTPRRRNRLKQGLDMIRNTIIIPFALFVAGAVPVCVVLVYAAAVATVLQ